MKNGEEMIKCLLCGTNLNTNQALLTHIQFKYKDYNSEKYYREFFMKSGEGFCKICNKPTKFNGLAHGYQTYCSNKCVWNDPEIKEKRKHTNAKKTVEENRE